MTLYSAILCFVFTLRIVPVNGNIQNGIEIKEIYKIGVAQVRLITVNPVLAVK